MAENEVRILKGPARLRMRAGSTWDVQFYFLHTVPTTQSELGYLPNFLPI